MDKVPFLIFYTETPDGPDYLSISHFGPDGLKSRRVFAVTEELESTPHIEGAKTKRLFIR